jgi:lysophospholipase L1-like esterase
MESKTPETIPTGTRLARHRLRKKFLLLSCAILVSFTLCESLLRLAGISFPQLYTPDPHCASRLRPGVSGWWITEGRGFVQINADGLRDRRHEVRKPDDVLRVAILGDSYTEALQVDAQNAFWAVAERELRRREQVSGREIEFLNFGVSGYGTAQELLMLRNYVWKYEPDVVLVAFCHNDIQDNSSALSGNMDRPYFTIRNDTLHLDSSFRESAGYLTALTEYEQTKADIVNRSYVLQLLKHSRTNWNLRHERSKISARGIEDIGSDLDVYRKPDTESGTMAWDVTERLIVAAYSDVIRHGARFGLLTVTTPLQVYPDPAVRNVAKENSTPRDLLYSENRLEALAAQHDFPVLTLVEPLQAHAESHDVYLHGFSNTKPGTGHWNEIGHRIAGQHLAAWLESDVLQ